MMKAQADRRPPDRRQGAPRTRLLLVMLGGALLWLALMVGSELLWRYLFDFSTSEAWALAVGLFAYIGLLIVVMLAVIVAVKQER